jgi:hypothetical protein
MPVETPRAEYNKALPRWRRVDDCCEGEDVVKHRGQEYLPPLDIHARRPEKYAAYLKRATFYNATGRTVQGLAGAIFQKPPKIEMPKVAETHTKDITLTGTSAEVFALDVVEQDLKKGRVGILVDMPRDAQPGARPYWVCFYAEDIPNWRTERRGGDEVLTRVVLREDVEESDPKDPFVTKTCDQYRVLELDAAGNYTVTLYRKAQASGKFEPWAPEGQEPTFTPLRRGAPLPFIPFVFIGPTSTSSDVEKPPLLDLANVNLAHYRNSADYEHGLHYTGIPIPWVSGAKIQAPIEPGQQAPPAVAGPDVWIELEKDGKFGIAQASGEMLGALEHALAEKKQQMTTLGARMLEPPGAAETATAVLGRAAGDYASLRTIAGAAEDGLTQAAQIHAWWLGAEAKPSDAKARFVLSKDVVSTKLSPSEVQTQLQLWIEGAISARTLYSRLQGGEWTQDGVSFEDEQKAIADERGAREGRDSAEATKKLTDALDDEGKPKPADGGPEQKDAGIALNLNGAQISSAMDIEVQVAEGVLPRDSGIAMLETLLGLAPAAAQRMVGTAGTDAHKPKPKAPAMPFGGAPPFPPKPKPGDTPAPKADEAEDAE